MFKDTIEKVFEVMIEELEHNDESYGIIVPGTDDWDKPLPDGMVKKLFKLDISEFAREQTYYEKGVLHVTVAFGEEEYSKKFLLYDIQTILDTNNFIVFNKPYSVITERAGYTLKSLIY